MKICNTILVSILAIPSVILISINAPSIVLPNEDSNRASSLTDKSNNLAIFAGGCFWCVESDFDKVHGILDTESGYIGGNSSNPTYKTHSREMHREAVKIKFDESVTSYEELLHIFWRSVNPTDGGGQFCDRGHSYTTAIYTLGSEQFELASKAKLALSESGFLDRPITTEIVAGNLFYPAETYHQNYYKKNPLRYELYRKACGRDKAVKQLWGDQAYTGISGH